MQKTVLVQKEEEKQSGLCTCGKITALAVSFTEEFTKPLTYEEHFTNLRDIPWISGEGLSYCLGLTSHIKSHTDNSNYISGPSNSKRYKTSRRVFMSIFMCGIHQKLSFWWNIDKWAHFYGLILLLRDSIPLRRRCEHAVGRQKWFIGFCYWTYAIFTC